MNCCVPKLPGGSRLPFCLSRKIALVVMACFSLIAVPSFGQEALRSSMAGEMAARSRKVSLENQPYNFKTGDFRLLLTPSVGLDYNDNIDLQESGGNDDFILRPMLRATASYPLTQNNLLFVDVGFGYDKYFNHNEYSQWRLDSGSQISFDIYVGDFWFNLHDRFSYQQDSARESSIANTGSYGTFENTVGLSVVWDMNDLTLTAGYDHHNSMSLEDQFAYQDRTSEMFLTRAGFRLRPDLTLGPEATASFTSYDENRLNDNSSYSAGVYADWKASEALTVSPRAGYTYYDFKDTSDVIRTADVDGWYMDLTVSHAITESLSYSLTGGHRFRLGVESDITEEWYVNAGVGWRAFRNLSFRGSLGYETGDQGLQSATDPTRSRSEVYDWITASVGADWPFMKRLALGLHYRASYRASDIGARDYLQNVVGLTLTYRAG